MSIDKAVASKICVIAAMALVAVAETLTPGILRGGSNE